jgi:glutamate synthase (NADPH/NADH) small chain
VDKHNKSSVDKIFATGDATMGASLVVKAIASGRKVAVDIHNFLNRQ